MLRHENDYYPDASKEGTGNGLAKLYGRLFAVKSHAINNKKSKGIAERRDIFFHA